MNPMIASAILPGLGETILGRKNEARAFFMIEGSLWLSYIGFNYFGGKMEGSSRAFAFEHAGANPARTDAEYFDNIEDFMDSDDYNLLVERDASYYYPDDLEAQQDYIERNGYFGDDAWEWDTLDSRVAYWEKRTAARENLRRASFMTGFMIINRIASVINVAVFSKNERVGLDARPGQIGFFYKF
jgi:hypothetical protein